MITDTSDDWRPASCTKLGLSCVFLEYKKPGPKTVSLSGTGESSGEQTPNTRSSSSRRQSRLSFAATASFNRIASPLNNDSEHSIGSADYFVLEDHNGQWPSYSAGSSSRGDASELWYDNDFDRQNEFQSEFRAERKRWRAVASLNLSTNNKQGTARSHYDNRFSRNASELPFAGVGSGNSAALALLGPSLQLSSLAVDRPLSMLPTAFAFPAQDKVGALVQTFWIYRAPIYMFVHPLTFAYQVRNNPMLVASMCLNAFPWINDADILRESVAVQERFLRQALVPLKAVLQNYLPKAPGYQFTRDGMDMEATLDVDEKLDHLCETVFAVFLLASWAAYRGLATLHAELTEIVVRLTFVIGLHRAPPADEKRRYGCGNSLTIYLRKVQRKSLWDLVNYTVCFSAHWTRRDITETLIHYGEMMVYPRKRALAFHIKSLEPDFDPSLYYAENWPDPDLKRPLLHGDFLSFAHFPTGSPEREMRLRVMARALADEETFNWGQNWCYWKLRIQVNRFIRDCLEANTTPAEIAVLDIATAPEILAKLAFTAKQLDSTIVDVLNGLSPPMKEAESTGNYMALMEFYRPSDPTLDESGAAMHSKTQYLLAIRLLRLEILSNFGVYTFDKIAKGALDGEFSSPRFAECLQEAIVYTRHMQNLLDHNRTIRHLGVGTGPTITKVGALNLALLAFLMRQSEQPRIDVLPLLQDLKRGVQTTRDLLTSFARGRPAQSMSWLTSVASVFGKLVGTLKKNPNYKAFFGVEAVGEEPGLEGLTVMEIQTANLQRDVVSSTEEDNP